MHSNLFSLSSCVLFQELFGITPSENSPSQTNQTGTKVGRPSSNQNQGTQIRSQIYKTPDSYGEAYKYRTDVAEQSIRRLITNKQIDSLRNTNPREYVRKIIEEINAVSKNDFEKIKMIHDVVTLLISYDAKSYWQGSIPAQDWQTVLSKRLAVCEGYSNLFKYMCDIASVNCEKVSGYARGVGSSLIDEDSPSNSNHAWNIVKINNAWYVVDCIWDSGYMDGRVAKQKYTTDWLFLKPEHMIYTHFPNDSRKQLLASPMTARDFYNLPEIKPKFFDAVNVKDLQTLPVKKMLANNSMMFPFSLNEGYELSVHLKNLSSNTRQKNCTLVQNNGEHSWCKILFPQKGIYLVDVFWGKTGSRGGQDCMQFIVEAEEASNIRFPQVYAVSAKNARLISPMEMPLKTDEPITFSVYVENRKLVTVIYGKNFIPLEAQGDGFFTGDVTIPRGVKQVSVAFAQSERGQYQTFAQFSVEGMVYEF
ncbi:MAG: hypothetical protein J6I73_02320 [Treponema sp.]|nr:hypothetical protein [Treponema sp.]